MWCFCNFYSLPCISNSDFLYCFSSLILMGNFLYTNKRRFCAFVLFFFKLYYNGKIKHKKYPLIAYFKLSPMAINKLKQNVAIKLICSLKLSCDKSTTHDLYIYIYIYIYIVIYRNFYIPDTHVSWEYNRFLYSLLQSNFLNLKQ